MRDHPKAKLILDGRQMFQLHFFKLMEWGINPGAVDLTKWAKYYGTPIPRIVENNLVWDE